MFKVYVKEERTRPPKDKIYYILAKNGLFIHKEVGFIKATVPVDGVPWLSPQEQEASLLLPNLPVELIAETLNFFKEVYDKYHSEAVVLSHYSEAKDAYLNDAPEQEVSGAAVPKYVAKSRFKSYQLVGSIHSHSNFGAFHSGIDDKDEEHFDGFHITIGDVDEEPTISVSIMVNGTRFSLEPEEMIDGIEMVKLKTKKVGFIKRRRYQNLGGIDADGLYGYGGINQAWTGYRRDEKYFRLLLPPGETLKDYPPDPEWLKRVRRAKPKRIIVGKGKKYYTLREIERNVSDGIITEKEGAKT